MAAYVEPILTKVVALLKDATTGLNAQIADIDANVQTIDATAYRKANTIFPGRLPWVSVFTFGEALVTHAETESCIFIEHPIYVTIDCSARNEEHLHYVLDVYNTAVIRAIIETGGWTLGNVVDILHLQSIGVTPIDGNEGNIIGGCFTRWQATGTYHPKEGA